MKNRLFLILGMLLLSSVAFAQSTCANPEVLSPNGDQTNFDFVAPATSNIYQFDVKPNRSYSVQVWMNYDPVNTDLTAGGGGAVVVYNDAACSVSVTLTDTTGAEPVVPSNAVRGSFVTGASVANTHYRLKVQNGNGATGRYISVKVDETTMFAPAYTAGGGYNTFYAFLNTTGQAVAGTLTLVPSNGNTPVTVPVNMAANGMVSTNTTAFTPTGPSGYAYFTHNGPPGAVAVTAAVANFSLATPYFQPVAFEAQRERK